MDSSFDLTPQKLLDQCVHTLQGLLGPGWQVSLRPEPDEAFFDDRGADAVVQVTAEGDHVRTDLLVEAKTRTTPKDVAHLLAPKAALMRRMGSFTHLVVVSPWISPRTQQTLQQHNIGYLDLTGNAWLRISRPAIVIHTHGEARRSPAAARKDKPQLSGPKAGRLVRMLADAAPPYRASELAEASRLSLPYVSRLLDALDDQLLIRRDGRTITDVDWRNLLRLRSEQLILLKHNPYVGMIAPNGMQALRNRLKSLDHATALQVALTGSYAARAVAPLAVGGQMMLYVPHTPHAPDTVGKSLGLLRVDEGADVLLLRAHDEVVFQRTVVIDGIRQVALSQLALDCLSGPGRMPAEGEAILQYMADNEDLWRASGISRLNP